MIPTDLASSPPADRSGARRRAAPLLVLRRWIALRRQRRALTALDDRLLDDIGLTRAQAEREAGRQVWDAPAHWRQRF